MFKSLCILTCGIDSFLWVVESSREQFLLGHSLCVQLTWVAHLSECPLSAIPSCHAVTGSGYAQPVTSLLGLTPLVGCAPRTHTVLLGQAYGLPDWAFGTSDLCLSVSLTPSSKSSQARLLQESCAVPLQGTVFPVGIYSGTGSLFKTRLIIY